MVMGNTLPIEFSPGSSEEHLGYLAILMLKDMFFYVLPYARRCLQPSKHTTTGKWLQQRQFIAAHVKSSFEKVKVYVVGNQNLCNNLVGQQMHHPKNPVHFIGLDCEWESRKKDGVAMLQISSGNDCILYRPCLTEGVFPDNLKKLLEDRKVLKFGVGIEEDVRRLRLHGIHVRGFVDLRNLAHRCLPVYNQGSEGVTFQWNSLSSLSNNTLDLQLSKLHSALW